MTQSYLVRLKYDDGSTGRYLALRPFDQSWGWYSPDMYHATPISADRAATFAAEFRAQGVVVQVIPDSRGRPAFDDAALMAEQLVNGR